MQTENINIITSASSLQDKGLILRKGEVYKCKVVDFVAGKAILDINNKYILAESEVPLSKGSELFLEVKGFLGDQVELKMSNIENKVLKEIVNILDSLKLQFNEKNLSLVKFFIKSKFPLEVISIISNAIHSEDSLSDSEIAFLVKLISEKVGIDENVLNINKLLVDANNLFEGKIEELFKTLKEISYKFSNLENTQKLINIFPDISEGIDGIADKLLNLVSSQLTSIENFLLNKFISGTEINAFEELRIILLKVLEEVENAGIKGRDKEKIKKALNEINNYVRAVNLTNTLSYDGQKEVPFVIAYLPLIFDDKVVASKLYIYKEKKKKIDPENLFLVIVLNLEKLGRLEVHLFTNKKVLSLSFLVEDERKKEIFTRYLNELEQKLNELKEYEINPIQIKILKKEEKDYIFKEVTQVAKIDLKV